MLRMQHLLSLTQQDDGDLHNVGTSPVILGTAVGGKQTLSLYHCMNFFPLATIC
jgi:hypothetical protein